MPEISLRNRVSRRQRRAAALAHVEVIEVEIVAELGGVEPRGNLTSRIAARMVVPVERSELQSVSSSPSGRKSHGENGWRHRRPRVCRRSPRDWAIQRRRPDVDGERVRPEFFAVVYRLAPRAEIWNTPCVPRLANGIPTRGVLRKIGPSRGTGRFGARGIAFDGRRRRRDLFRQGTRCLATSNDWLAF